MPGIVKSGGDGNRKNKHSFTERRSGMKSPHPTTCRGVLPVYVRAQSCLTLCDSTDCGPPGSSVHGISQARILEWVCHFLLQGNLPDPGIEPASPASPASAHGFFTVKTPRKPVVALPAAATAAESLQSCPTLYNPMDGKLTRPPPVLGFSRQEHWHRLPFPRVSQSGKAPDTSSVGVV